MQDHSATLPVSLVQRLFAGLAHRPLVPEQVFKQAGIPDFLWQVSSGRITLTQFAQLYRLLVVTCDDETPGFFSRPLRCGTLKWLCLGLLDAATLKVALHRFIHFFHILQDDLQCEVVHEQGLVWVRLVEVQALQGERVVVHELMLKLIHGIASWLIKEEITPRQLACAYPRPHLHVDYLTFYPVSGVFDQPFTGLAFDPHWLNKPVRQTRDQLTSFLHRAPQDWIQVPLGERRLSAQVREELLRGQSLNASVAEVADALYLSVRSLTRKLKFEGTGFQQIKDEVRRDWAVQQLVSTQTRLSVLAAHLGYEDLASFSRAFRRWTGSPPRAYRQGRRAFQSDPA